MPLIIIMLMAYMLLPIVGEITIYSGMYDIPREMLICPSY